MIENREKTLAAFKKKKKNPTGFIISRKPIKRLLFKNIKVVTVYIFQNIWRGRINFLNP